MKIFVKVKAGVKREEVKKVDENHYEVMTKAAPEKGKANAEVKELLAKHFKVAKSMVEIKAGQTTKNKIIRITNLH